MDFHRRDAEDAEKCVLSGYLLFFLCVLRASAVSFLTHLPTPKSPVVDPLLAKYDPGGGLLIHGRQRAGDGNSSAGRPMSGRLCHG